MLMYHALVPRNELDKGPTVSKDGAARSDPYALSEAVFAEHVSYVARAQANTPRSWDDVSRSTDAPQVWFTFDDGHRSDLEVALPVLKKHALTGMFFITTDWIGTSGFMDAADLRELATEGMLLGTHGSSHRFLADLDDGEVEQELATSKMRLEDVLGSEIAAVALPGGRSHPAARRIARKLGYRFVFTSRIGVADRASDPLDLPRLPVTRGLPASFVADLLAGDERMVRTMARLAQVKGFAKSLLGNRLYHRLWHWSAKWR